MYITADLESKENNGFLVTTLSPPLITARGALDMATIFQHVDLFSDHVRDEVAGESKIPFYLRNIHIAETIKR